MFDLHPGKKKTKNFQNTRFNEKVSKDAVLQIKFEFVLSIPFHPVLPNYLECVIKDVFNSFCVIFFTLFFLLLFFSL